MADFWKKIKKGRDHIMKEHNFDLMVSLGGNCSAAGQLKQRTLQTYSLPFDAFFLRDEIDIRKMLKAFANDFNGCFNKLNLRLLTGEERGNSELKYQYQDMVSGYNIIHLFHDSKDNPDEYRRCVDILNRRLKRFYEYCETAKTICFFLTLTYEISMDLVLECYETLKERFNTKEISLVVVNFSCERDEFIESEHIEIRKIKRPANDYDFYRSNIEWIWLEDFTLNQRKKIEQEHKKENYIARMKFKEKFLILHLFNFFSTLISIKIYVFGLRLWICIGRLRNL